MRLTLAIALILLSTLGSAGAEERSSTDPSDTVWNALKIFEGDVNTVTGDFDCQGMSIGVAQWNVGKSFPSVKQIVQANSVERVAALMPTHGRRLWEVLRLGKNETLAYVRFLQVMRSSVTILTLSSCDANTRQARWTADGKLFVKELSLLLSTPESIAAQWSLRRGIFMEGSKNAQLWAKAVRGEGAVATLREIAYFVDMQNFNGGGLQKFALLYSPLAADARSKLATDALNYLANSNEPFLLHRQAAKKNAQSLNPSILDDSSRDLFCLSYLVALKLNADHARQFRLTTINRRSAILFGEAYYSDRDPRPTRVALNP